MTGSVSSRSGACRTGDTTTHEACVASWCPPCAGRTTSTSRSTRSAWQAARSPQVSRRLFAALEDLLAVAPEERRPALEEQRALLTLAVSKLDRDRRDRATAMNPDGQGLGATVDGRRAVART